MKSSYAMSTSAQAGFQASSTSLSVHSFGDMPWACALRITFSPCSSVPVRYHLRSPRWACQRVRTSPATVVYALPMCGAAVT
jgi:hypothetical protein